MEYILPFVPARIKSLPVHMDFHGQKRAERTFQIIILLFAAVGFGWGYVCQQFSQTMYILLAGVVLSCLLTLPPWSMYRRNPVPWQSARPQHVEGEGEKAAVTPSLSQQKSKKKSSSKPAKKE